MMLLAKDGEGERGGWKRNAWRHLGAGVQSTHSCASSLCALLLCAAGVYLLQMPRRIDMALLTSGGR